MQCLPPDTVLPHHDSSCLLIRNLVVSAHPSSPTPPPTHHPIASWLAVTVNLFAARMRADLHTDLELQDPKVDIAARDQVSLRSYDMYPCCGNVALPCLCAACEAPGLCAFFHALQHQRLDVVIHARTHTLAHSSWLPLPEQLAGSVGRPNTGGEDEECPG